MNKYAALFEDEDDIFAGTPKSKFWDMLTTPHEDIAKETLDEIVTRYAVMENILKKTIDEELINSHLDQYYFENSAEVEETKKSLYMEFVGNIVYKMPQ
ncbi:MAG: DUF2018 family protein [Epsilonproteobacteria bacterium]|nr:DUF2018 family protein [Campylobacterota bacterium]